MTGDIVTDQGPGAPPVEGISPPQEPPSREQQLETENAKLRADRRKDRAELLGIRHGLDEATVELLQNVPLDQMDAKAEAIAKARGTQQPAPPTPPSGDPPPGDPPVPPTPPAEPPNKDVLEQFGGTPPGTPPEPPESDEARLIRRINEATSHEEVVQIQQEEQERRRAAGRA